MTLRVTSARMKALVLIFGMVMGITSANAGERMTTRLGEYRVREVLQKNSDATVWSSDCTGDSPDPACGQRFDVARSGSELAFVQPSEYPSHLDTFLFMPALLQPKCAYSAASSADLEGLLNSSICRATRAPKLDADGTVSYFYSPGINPETDDIANAIVAYSLTGLPIGISSAYEVRFPVGVTAPQSFEVHLILRGVILFLPAKIEKRYLMERVGS
jgi:hypothetical protein